MSDHECVYRRRAVAVRTAENRGLLTTEYAYARVCDHGIRSGTRKVPEVAFVEFAATELGPLPDLAPAQRVFAAKVLSRLKGKARWSRIDRFLQSLEDKHPSFDQATVLHLMCRSGLLQLRGLPDGATFTHAWLIDEARLADLLDPGHRQRIQEAKQWARHLAAESGPAALRLQAEFDHLDDWPPQAIQVAAIACLLQDMDVRLPARTASSWFLGDTKILEDHIDRVAGWLGAATNFTTHTPMAFLGGGGSLSFPVTVIFDAQLPFVALPRETVRQLKIRFPPGGLAVIEGKTAFEEACRGRVPGLEGLLCLWSGGQPGPDIRHIVQIASQERTPILTWFDLDGEGILGARLVNGWSNGNAKQFGMDVSLAEQAPVRRPLTGPKWKTGQLQASSADTYLTDMAKWLVENRCWIEQEALLARQTYEHLRKSGAKVGVVEGEGNSIADAR